MQAILLIFEIICLLEYNSCSLLSRMKNHYEYVSQESTKALYTEDLYDFEFTNIKTTMKSSFLKVFNEIDHAEEDFYHIPHIIKLNITERNRKRTNINNFDEDFNNFDEGNSATPETSKNTEQGPLNDSSMVSPTNTSPPMSTTSLSPLNNTITVSPVTSPTSTSSTILTTKNTTLNITTTTSKNETVKSYCYRCGLNETRIPPAYCYYIFEGGDDKSFITRKHHFKIKCIRSDTVKEEKRIAFGPSYRLGCFKRFLDVGIEYNERGCRTVVPTKGKSFASKRFAKMEYLLKHVDDGCVFSPYATVTPFSRSISLYARYHVCVCSQKYCNRTNSIKLNLRESNNLPNPDKNAHTIKRTAAILLCCLSYFF
ncbi:uncharacterized protein LOC120636562 [Pararge aegeria]|uniref:uncharacterized protein LOC120636562 n=1 Tax=Pararge aegeria TaxID=116150 RepID=UPI0019D2BAB8|nr:uncharacterized protein LOC120636562 [Pararge aegeria]